MRTVAEDQETITIQFTHEEARHLRSTANYVSSLFEFLDREALDLSRMSVEDAEQLAIGLSELTTASIDKTVAARGG